MSSWDNYHEVVNQMECYGIPLRDRDLPLRVNTPKRVGCGKAGKWWYWLRSFEVRGKSFLVGRFGSYKTGDSEKVEWNAPPLSEEDRARFRAEREAAERKAAEARRQEAEFAAANARQQWARGAVTGTSAYLTKKGVEPEACRYMPDGSILIPLLRYDFDREHALRAVQRIYPGPRTDRRTGEDLPSKTFTKGFDPNRCSLRLGLVEAGAPILVCEGYATGLTLRMACDRRIPVFVALNAGNLASVTALVREIYGESRILICADDDWRTTGPDGEPLNVGRVKAAEVAKALPGVDVVYPVWRGLREPGDTDFNDLHAREGLEAVRRQLSWVLQVIRNKQVPHA